MLCLDEGVDRVPDGRRFGQEEEEEWAMVFESLSRTPVSADQTYDGVGVYLLY